jgi:hypothetical protein
MRVVIVALAIGLAGVVAVAGDPQQTPPSTTTRPVTFSRDVLPILQKHCQSCHRPGEIAPMSFLTYESTRPWARAIKTAVVAKKMPPWFADPQHGRFSNDRSLTAGEVETLSAWADSGAMQGNPADMPPTVSWPDGWQIKPDHIVTAPAYTVPATGTVEWGYIVVPTGFTEDTWVSSIEIRPGNRAAVHHVVAYVQPHSPDVPHNVMFWDQKRRDGKGVALPGQAFLNARMVNDAGQEIGRGALLGGELGAVYVPGGQPQDFRAYDAAALIPAGSDLVLNVHYQTTGTAVTEITRMGFTVAKQPPSRRFVTLARQPASITNQKIFRIPAGEANWSSPPVEILFNVDAELAWMMPDMHARGKDMSYKLTFPDGRSEVALSVPRYDFEWQLGYIVASPIKLPKGTQLRVDAHFDNSAAKRGNPDPTVDVFGGTQTWEEMMNPWFGILIDKDANPDTVISTTAIRGGA